MSANRQNDLKALDTEANGRSMDFAETGNSKISATKKRYFRAV
jgi:hypothetical protein